MKKLIFLLTYYILLTTYYCSAQVQWASKVIDFSSEYKDDVIRENSTRWSASQVLGYPNTTKYVSSQLAWTPKKQTGSKEFVTVGFNTPQMVQQVIVGENANAGSVCEIILYDNAGKKYTVYENENPTATLKFDDVLTYFKIKPTYNVVKLKLVINTNTSIGRKEIDCIGISSTTVPYKQNINVIKYSEPVGQPENLGANVNSQFYDHLPLISPDGSILYFTRKLTDENNTNNFNDEIYVSQVLPTGKFAKAENIGTPLNTADNNFACFISRDNNRLYVANKYIRNTYNYAGLSVSTKNKEGEWSKPKPLNIPNLYNKNEFAHYHMNLDENIVLMSIQRDDSYGDLDLYVSQKYSDGDWSEPKNLGPVINTVGAEGSVFLAADGRTLYFSSSGHPGFGSYDMYMSKRLDDSWTNWSKPLNLGDKINTDEMDIYYTIPASGDYAYFSSGVTVFGKNDLYRIRLPKEARPDYVDIKKFVASAPLKKNTTTVTVNAQLAPTSQSVKTIAPQTTIPPKVVTPAPSNNSQTDDLQRKLDDLKKQQSQVVAPAKPVAPPAPSVTETPITKPTPTVTLTPTQTPVVTNTTPATATVPITPHPEVKKEVLNTIQPYQSPEELRQKPATVNTIKPVETPKPAPKVLSQEELAAREQQKNNPTINPNNDGLNSITKKTMPVTPPPTAVAQSQNVINPNIITNEVDPNSIATPIQTSVAAAPPVIANAPAETPAVTSNRISNNVPLKTSSLQTDELQKKLDELKMQQTQNRINAPSNTPANTKPTDTRTIAEQYPNPQAVLPTSSAKTDDLQQKLEALKEQQRQVGQSNKIYADPYQTKPYAPQPIKEKQEDKATADYDDYQKKLDELKKQQKNVAPTASNKSAVKNQKIGETPQTPNPPVVTAPSAVNTQPVTVSQMPNPIISKYEEKLKKIKEEMAALGTPTNTSDSKLPATTSVTPAGTPVTPAAPSITAVVADQVKKEEPVTPPSEPSAPVTDVAPIVENNSTPVTETTIPVLPTTNLAAEKAKLDSIQNAQKLAEQYFSQTLDKMGTSKQTLEKDIADLKDQRTKFSDEKDKLAAQNSQLTGEKEKLEAEKKKMDDLLAQMQAERDKLAEEKLKMEQDKAKLDLLKKQQERDVLALKRSIDSLGKIQQKTASSVQLQQNYDLFNVPLQVGAVAQVNNIYFVADASFLQIPSYPELDKVVLFLARNKNLKVEVGGHTNGLCDDAYCQKLSTSRAKTCVDYLISKGIAANRLTYKGYGKTQLLKPEAPGNSLNQRVEIKILSVE